MRVSLVAALKAIKSGTAFRIANEAEPGNAYLLNSILPEENHNTYVARTGNMTVRTTMAGMVGMDSPYPESGFVEMSEMSEETTKIANRLRLPEKMLRELHEFLRNVRDGVLDNGGTLRQAATRTNEEAAKVALNFVDKIIVQAHMDTFEYLRGQALSTGKIDWVFNKKRLRVDYGVPAANKFAKRTGADGYGGESSKFWADHRAAKRILGSIRAIICQSDVKEMILANAANQMEILTEMEGGAVEVVRLVGDQARRSTDARDRSMLIPYDRAGEVINPTNTEETIQVPFVKAGKLIYVGDNIVNGFRIGVNPGSTADPEANNRLGHTHIAPTIEGDGAPGRWADVRTPDGEPWALESRGVTNGLPMLEAPHKLVILETDVA